MEINKITNNTVNNILKVNDIINNHKVEKNEEKVVDKNAEEKNINIANNEKGIGRKINILA